jgi:hypothetical protein
VGFARCDCLQLRSARKNPAGVRRQHWISKDRPHAAPGDAYVAVPEIHISALGERRRSSRPNWILPGAVDSGRIEAQAVAVGMIGNVLRAKPVAPSSQPADVDSDATPV